MFQFVPFLYSSRGNISVFIVHKQGWSGFPSLVPGAVEIKDRFYANCRRSQNVGEERDKNGLLGPMFLNESKSNSGSIRTHPDLDYPFISQNKLYIKRSEATGDGNSAR